MPEAPSTVHRLDTYRGADASAALLAQRNLSPAERPYRPLTSREKFHRFAHTLYSPYTLVSGAYDATWAQAFGNNYAYGGGMEGWGKRLGAAYASTATHQFFGDFLLPTVLHQDPRYFPLYHGTVIRRLIHASSRTLTTKGDDGRREINYSGLLAIGATNMAENLWLPDRRRTTADTLNRVFGSLQASATGYVLREFTPDLIRIFKKHSPKSLRNVEDKIPPQIISGSASNDE